ncbi:MAG: hypothetical protein R3F13_12310 [Prosthecobacter sp.]
MTTTSILFTTPKENSVTSLLATTFCRIAATAQNSVYILSQLGLLLPLAGACAVSVVSRHASGHWTPWAAVTAFLCIYSSYLIDHLSEVDAF